MTIRRADWGGERGSAMVTVALAVATLSLASFSILTLSSMASKEGARQRRVTASRFVAEGALTEALQLFRAGADVDLGSEEAPLASGGASYYVEEFDVGSGMTSLIATATDGIAVSRLELVLRERNEAFFRWAAFGDEDLSMDSNARVDSYNSDLGSYASQATNGGGSSQYALSNGNIGSNADVLMEQNSKVWGDAVPGPGSTASILGSAVVSGSTVPNTELVDLPGLVMPAGSSTGDMSVGNGDDITLAGGTHVFDALEIGTNGSLSVAGPATILVDSLNLRSGSELRVDATGGEVEIYVRGDFVMNSNTLIGSTTLVPSDLAIYLESDNVINPDETVDLDEIDFDSNAQLYGTLYAPSARIEINSNFELFGSLVARQVHLDSNCRIHFDEALLDDEEDSTPSIEAVCWRPVSKQYTPQAVAVEVGTGDPQ